MLRTHERDVGVAPLQPFKRGSVADDDLAPCNGAFEEGLDIRRELYLGIVIDRQTGKPVFMASASGGMDIEEVAAEHPEAILKEYIQK